MYCVFVLPPPFGFGGCWSWIQISRSYSKIIYFSSRCFDTWSMSDQCLKFQFEIVWQGRLFLCMSSAFCYSRLVTGFVDHENLTSEVVLKLWSAIFKSVARLRSELIMKIEPWNFRTLKNHAELSVDHKNLRIESKLIWCCSCVRRFECISIWCCEVVESQKWTLWLVFHFSRI